MIHHPNYYLIQVSAAIKDKERLERLSTVRAAEKGMKEELQEKIQIKQEEAAKRQAANIFSHEVFGVNF